MAEIIRCPKGHAVEPTDAFCPKCGNAIAATCPEGHAVRPGSAFCIVCGAPITAAAPRRLGLRSGSRRGRTLIAGSVAIVLLGGGTVAALVAGAGSKGHSTLVSGGQPISAGTPHGMPAAASTSTTRAALPTTAAPTTTTPPQTTNQAFQELEGTWVAPGFVITFAPSAQPGQLTTVQAGGIATPTVTEADFEGAQAGSGSLHVTYNFASAPNVVTVSDGSSTFQASRQTVAATPTTATTAPPLPIVTLGSYTGTKPSEIDLSGDAGNIITGIVWSSWTNSGAVGYGTRNIQGCIPDCADGSDTPVPTTVYLSHVVGGQFTLLEEDSQGEQPYTQSLPGA